ncbi:hypothetical protein EJB05_06646, partial [Eragrostis curvula]
MHVKGTIQSDLLAGDLLEMLSSPFRKVSQVPKGRGRKPEIAGKDEDSVEECWAYPSLCNWYKDEDSDEEGRVSLSCLFHAIIGTRIETQMRKVGCLLHALIGTRINSLRANKQKA